MGGVRLSKIHTEWTHSLRVQATSHLPVCALTSQSCSHLLCFFPFLLPLPQLFFLSHPSYYIFVRDFPKWSQQFFWKSLWAFTEASGPPLGHPLCLAPCVSSRNPRPCQAPWIWLTWGEPSGQAGHQGLPALLVRFFGEAFASGPPEAGGQRARLAP